MSCEVVVNLLSQFHSVSTINEALNALESVLNALKISIPDLLCEFVEAVIQAEKEAGTF